MPKKKTKKTTKTPKKTKCCEDWKNDCCSSSSAVYWLGFIGAAIYNISVSTGFWVGVWGVIKALVWPAFVIYTVMQHLGM